MNVLLNFFPVQSGGGQQVASSFLKIISQNDLSHNWYVFVGEGSELATLSKSLLPEKNILSVKYSYLARFTNDKLLQQFSKQNDINIIYNYAVVLPIPGIPQVVRTVYSNLYFPEIKFWNSYSKTTQLKKKLIDHFRLKGTLKADGLIFENESMLDRAISLFNYPKENAQYIEPSVSFFDETQANSDFVKLSNSKEFKILYLSSWHLNKRITILPMVAFLLKQAKIEVKFVLSLDQNDPSIQEPLMKNINTLSVTEYFEFIGKVKAIHVHQVVKSCDAMILLSKLECFSSNVIEAFYFKRPLIIADEPWANAACQNAALFVDRDNAEDIFSKISLLIKQEEMRTDLVEKGTLRLREFNTPEEKVIKQVKFLEYIYGKF